MNDKTIQRNRLSHADYHRVCVYLGSLSVDNVIEATLQMMQAKVIADLGLSCSEQQLRGICKELGYSYTAATPAAAQANLQHQIDLLVQRVENIACFLKQQFPPIDQEGPGS